MDGFLNEMLNLTLFSSYPESGATDNQANAISSLAGVVALHAGSPDLLPTVEKFVRVTQNTDDAVAFGCAAARILEKAVLNGKASYVEPAPMLMD